MGASRGTKLSCPARQYFGGPDCGNIDVQPHFGSPVITEPGLSEAQAKDAT